MLILHILVACLALLLIGVVLLDGFETVVLPRRVSRRFRLTRIYARTTWAAWLALARRIRLTGRREALLAVFGPLALLSLLGLWAALLILGFGLLLWGLGTPLTVTGGATTFGTNLYFSGTTLLTLGLGDVVPRTGLARLVTVVEVGTGFALLALVIGYLPVLYQAFSRREVRISLLDAHAGSPPTAGTLILRHPPNRRAARLTGILAEWERWSAELLETHLSYPLLGFYRSQHEEQSWVAALAMILDACALILACNREPAVDQELTEQAAFTFAMARHAAADLAQIFKVEQRKSNAQQRLQPGDRARLRELLVSLGLGGHSEAQDGVEPRLDTLRRLYEPYLAGLAQYLLMNLPPWVPPSGSLDDWQTTADDVTAPSITTLISRPHLDERKVER
jgi:hypothetical protein